MSLEGEEEGAGEASASPMANGSEAFKLKTENKRKSVVSSEVAEGLTVKKRFLRSDSAKQRQKVTEEAKDKIFKEDSAVLSHGSDDISENSCFRGLVSVKQSKAKIIKTVLRSSDGRFRRRSKEPKAEKFSEEAGVGECMQDGTAVSLCEEGRTCVGNGQEQVIACVDDTEAQKKIVTQLRSCNGRFRRSKEPKPEKFSEEAGVGECLQDGTAVSLCEEGRTCVGDGQEQVIVCVDDTEAQKKIVTQDVALGTDHKKSSFLAAKHNDAEMMNCEEEKAVENEDAPKGTEGSDTHAVGVGDAHMAEYASKTDCEIRFSIINKETKVKQRLENRRITRSRTAKLMEEVDADSDKERSTEMVSLNADQNENNTSNQAGIEIEEVIVESNICKKDVNGRKVETVKRRSGKSDAVIHEDKADSPRGTNKSMEAGVETKRSWEASDNGVNAKRSKTDLSNNKMDQAEELGERKKLKMGSCKSSCLGSGEAEDIKIRKYGRNVKRIKSNFKRSGSLEGTKIKWSKQICEMTLTQLKQNVCSPAILTKGEPNDSHHKVIKVQGVSPSSSLSSANKKMLQPQKSHNETAISKKESSYVTRIGTESLSPSKEPKNVDTSSDRKDTKFLEENMSPQARKEKEEELKRARRELRGQIKSMLLNAGWTIDLRRRHGKNYTDSVYVSPEGCTHWSIVKAYYAFEKCFSCKWGNKGEYSSEKLHKRPWESSIPSFSPITEEALSILKHPISRRRTKRELEESKLDLGDGSTDKKRKKHGKYKSSQKKDGIQKGRASKVSSKKLYKRKYRKRQKGCALLVRGFNHDAEISSDVYVPYAWKRTILSWMIDLGIMHENTGVKCMNRRRTKTLLKGAIRRDGIHCSCCNKLFTVTDFEIHAGSKQCNPYQNILVEEDDTSLLQCQMNAWKKQDESERRGFYSIDIHGDDHNDDTCGICGDGGDLICCDGCPSTYHQSCLGTEMLPPGDWYCMNCSCRYCSSNSGILAQGNGVESKLLSCSHCEERYHQICVPKKDAVITTSSRTRSLFCGQTCKKVFDKLRMLLGVKNFLDEGFSWTIVKRFDEDLPESLCTVDQRTVCNSKTAVALGVMDECFLPIIDQRSGINLIRNVVYNCGSNFNRLNYSGFYTFVLERNDEIISVASLRIHGTRAAEMPFIGTRNTYRRQGMCRRLLNEIESVLRSFNVEKLIIPAISELKTTWTNVFGFKVPEILEEEEIRSINLLVFPGTGLLLKPLLEKDSLQHCKVADKGADEVVLPPVIGPEPHASVDVIVQDEHVVKDLEPNLGAYDCSVDPHSRVSIKPCGAYVDVQASALKSLKMP